MPLSRKRGTPPRTASAGDLPRDPAPAGATPHRSLLRPLGIVGYDAVEPALLAALATEEPLLLVSDHGAAKTLLLVRLAEALGVELRHYNASLLQFDDLAGFPIPCERTGAIRYAAPPGAVWGAEAVFFDEIGRCRPETANKLFPIVHERRIQGVALERLRYRWAATNPPPEVSDADALDVYSGVEVLDPALADRFAYVVALPSFQQLGEADRFAIIAGRGEAPRADGGAAVRELVEAARDVLDATDPALRDTAAAYVLALAPRLRSAKVTVGGRRAAMLARNIAAVCAACTVLGRRANEDAFVSALLASIPDVVRRPLSRAQLLAAHKGAWEQVTLPTQDPGRILLAVRDPVRRAALSTTLPGLRSAVRGEALCGALGQMSRIDAGIVAWLLLPRLVGSDRIVPATAVETVASIVDDIAGGGHPVRGWGAAAAWIAEVRASLARSELGREDAEYVANAVCAHASLPGQLSAGATSRVQEEIVAPALDTWRRCAAALGGADAAGGDADTQPSAAREVA